MRYSFVWPSEKAVKVHGNFNCVWCKKDGLKVKGKVPTLRKSIVWRREYCACDEHVTLSEEQIRKEVNRESRDLTEADYQTWMRL